MMKWRSEDDSLLLPDAAWQCGSFSPMDGFSGEASPSSKWQHPPSFYCPISQQVMHDPVVLSDGHTYERRHIERWLQDRNTSPVSNEALPQTMAFPNHALRNAIEEYFEQVFSVHRRAIRKTIKCPEAPQSLGSNEPLLCTIDALMQCSFLMNADLNVECVLRQIMDEAKRLLGTEAASVFLFDAAKQELYSTVNSTGREIRIPITSGIAGHVASTGESLVIHDAYSDERFNRANDLKTGFRTRNMMCVPLKSKKGAVIGVVQIINKTVSGVFSRSHSRSTESGRPDFTSQDLQFLQVFASQAATAVANSGGVTHETQVQAQSQQSDGPNAGDESSLPNLKKHTISEMDEGPPIVASASLAIAQSDEVSVALQQAFTGWQFDALTLAEMTNNQPLSTLGMYIFENLGLIRRLGLDTGKLNSFFLAVESGYDHANPYHNRAHAASVLHVMHALLRHGGIAADIASVCPDADVPSGKKSDLETLACLLAAAIHDHEHLGLTNEYLVRTSHSRAMLYNDQHVNEHHHVASGFAILQRPENNFLANLSQNCFSRLRSLVIELVLGTDMANGTQIQKSFVESFGVSDDGNAASQPTPTSSKNVVLLLQMAMKCADLGHLTLEYDVHAKWVERLEVEFFAQGDNEKMLGHPVSFLMDRHQQGCSKTQVPFFQHVVLPLLRSLVSVVPLAQPMLQAALSNYEKWQQADVNDAPVDIDANAVNDSVLLRQTSWAARDSLASDSTTTCNTDECDSNAGLSVSLASASTSLVRQDDEPRFRRCVPESLDVTVANASRTSKKKSGRARQRAARWWATVRQRTPSPDPSSPLSPHSPDTLFGSLPFQIN
jgi:hypothetical protein